MGRIHLLDDAVINKIAAGEVVERPASVVKELVENAIDAGATRVSVGLEQGGIKSIVITDNGQGISEEDLPRAVTRHATSKISNADDLFQIQSMGFRGEALASVGAVSKLQISTQQEGQPSGHRLGVIGGDLMEILPWNGPVGTVVAVTDLFFNVPVREKFLKAPATEYSYCMEVLQAIAMCHPEVSFLLQHNNKEQWSYPAATEESASEQLRTRVSQVLGAQKSKDLIFVENEGTYAKLRGFVSPPGMEKPNSKHLYIFVNGRYVKDRGLRYGILRGYHSHLLKGRYPIAVLFLEMDPSLVDVNVHPAKTEVRLQYGNDVQTQVATAIRGVMRQGAWSGSQPPQDRGSPFATPTRSAPLADGLFVPPATSASRPPSAADIGVGGAFFSPSRSSGRSDSSFSARPVGSDILGDTAPRSTTSVPLQETEVPVPWDELTFVGAFARCYLFFSTPDERMLVVDQHAFHERVLFERLLTDEKLLNSRQPLLMPEEVSLTPTQLATLAERKEDLLKRGFAFDETEGGVEVQEIPAILMGKDIDGLFQELSDPECAEESTESNGTMARLILATIACHAAVRAGEELGENELKILLAEAPTVNFYHNCPHGRRVFKWWSKGQVERWFDR